MVVIDFIGVILTIILVSLRYPQCALLALVVHEMGRLLMVLFLHRPVENIITAGAFGTAILSDDVGARAWVIDFSGSLANYIFCTVVCGMSFESVKDIKNILSPWGKLKFPLAAANMKLAAISSIVYVLRLFNL